MQHNPAPASLYEKWGVLGQGAYGTVLKVRNVKTNTFHAMKRVKSIAKTERVPKASILECNA